MRRAIPILVSLTACAAPPALPSPQRTPPAPAASSRAPERTHADDHRYPWTIHVADRGSRQEVWTYKLTHLTIREFLTLLGSTALGDYFWCIEYDAHVVPPDGGDAGRWLMLSRTSSTARDSAPSHPAIETRSRPRPPSSSSALRTPPPRAPIACGGSRKRRAT